MRLKIVFVIRFQKSFASKIGVPKNSIPPLNKIVNSCIYACFNLFINNTFSLNLFFFNSGFKAKVVRQYLLIRIGRIYISFAIRIKSEDRLMRSCLTSAITICFKSPSFILFLKVNSPISLPSALKLQLKLY